MRSAVLPVGLLVLFASMAAWGENFSLLQQSRDAQNEKAQWPAEKTAFIVCDVWDAHHSVNAVKRLEEMLPRMNEVLGKAREMGAVIIHSPSDCMDTYADHPARKRALDAPTAKNAPERIDDWVMRIDAEQGAPYPVDQSDGGEDDDTREHKAWAKKLEEQGRNPGMPWKAQNPGIEIDEERDYISDKGGEVWNVLEAKGIENVVLVGVHTNMCVLGRPFGLRQMARAGKQVVLMRDMTDCMYNPARWPRVDHFTGNDLVMAYVERYVCPTITSDQILGGEAFRFADDERTDRALPALPPRDPKQEWSPLPTTAEDLPKGVTSVWYRCVVDRGGAGMALEHVDGFGITLHAWLDGAELTVQPGQTPLGEAADPAWLVVRADLDETAPRMALAPKLIDVDTSKAIAARWQYRFGKDDYSTMPLPAKFGGSPEIYVER